MNERTEAFQLTTDDGEWPVVLRRQNRKTIALTVRVDGTIEVRVPAGVAADEVRQFVRSKQAWIRRSRTRQLQQNAKRWPWQPGVRIPVLGKAMRIVLEAEGKPDDGSLLVSPRSTAEADVRKACLARLKPRLETLLGRQTGLWAKRLYGTRAQDVTCSVRWMRSRWASCSRDRRMRFNLALVFVPEELVELVVVHELCHWREFSHNRAFYDLLASALPDWKRRDDELKAWDHVLTQ
jgi:hypothetical protein